MRRGILLLAALLLIAAPGSAAAQSPGGIAAPDASGGAAYGTPELGPGLVVRTFRVTPAAVRPGTRLTVVWRIDGRVRRTQVRIDLLPAAGGPVAATLRLGHRRTHRRLRVHWTPRLAPGSYTARLRATAVRAHRRAHVSTLSSMRVTAPPAVAVPSSGVFPVQGPYSFGGADARFGAERDGHVHQGQDVTAATGTPVVTPRAGFVYWRDYQASGAGFYLVVRGDDGRDYVFMHLQKGSLLVTKGQAVLAGQRIGAVGATGDAGGPHLHFEIWPGGWYAKDSHPIDPLPDLQAWAAALTSG
jgi:murein DD-endopeptidase MepM/ murein hydrolase activator NlpD